MTEERLAQLMVKSVDGVASPMEKEELMSHIVGKPDLYREYELQLALKTVTDGWVGRLALDSAEDAHAAQALSFIEQGVGTTFVLLGLGLLTGGGIYTAITSPEAPFFIRYGLPLFAAGALILLGSAIRWKIQTGKSDKYTEVTR